MTLSPAQEPALADSIIDAKSRREFGAAGASTFIRNANAVGQSELGPERMGVTFKRTSGEFIQGQDVEIAADQIQAGSGYQLGGNRVYSPERS